MSPLPFLKAMRPVRALLITALYTGVAWMQLRFALKQPASVQACNTVALVLPFFWASLLAGGLHGIMHRNAFPLLPGAIQRARATYLALATTGVLAGILLALLIDPQAPLAAIAGLAAIVSTIPLLNTRRRPLYRGLLNPWFPISFTVLGTLVFVFPATLPALLSGSPWLVLIAGLGLSALIVRHAFDPKQVRARQEVFFVSVLATMDLRPHRMVANNQFYSKELVRSNEVTLKTKEIKLHSRAQLGEQAFWTERMQQVRFNGVGKAPQSPLRQLVIMSLASFVPLVLMMLITSLFSQDLPLQTQARMIVDWTRDGGSQLSNSENAGAATAGLLLFAMPFLMPLVMYPVLRLRLRVWMPVPRQLQARIIFRSALKLVLCYQPLVLLPISLIIACALWLGVPLGFWVATTTLTIALAALPLAPLVLCSSFLRSSLLRTLIPSLAMIGAIILSAVLPRFNVNLLSPLSVLAFLGATAAGFALLKRAIDGRYLRGDLDGEMNNAF